MRKMNNQRFMRTYTEEEAYLKLTALCATAEHCPQEMADKMQRWGIGEEAQQRIIDRLIEGKYIDEERYCRAFVRDKIDYSKWGRRKIEQALFVKRIPKAIQQQVLGEVDDETYVEILRPLLASKRKGIRADNSYEMNGKLIRFAMQRGFTMDIIRRCIDDADEYEPQDD